MSAWRDPGVCDPPPSPENRRPARRDAGRVRAARRAGLRIAPWCRPSGSTRPAGANRPKPVGPVGARCRHDSASRPPIFGLTGGSRGTPCSSPGGAAAEPSTFRSPSARAGGSSSRSGTRRERRTHCGDTSRPLPARSASHARRPGPLRRRPAPAGAASRSVNERTAGRMPPTRSAAPVPGSTALGSFADVRPGPGLRNDPRTGRSRGAIDDPSPRGRSSAGTHQGAAFSATTV